MKIYFISDAHLSYLIYANRQRINRDTYRAGLSVADYICNDGAKDKAVVFCGDNLDSKAPCPSDVQAFQAIVSKFMEALIPVYAIEGNHDKVAARIAAGEEDPEDLSAGYANCQWLDLIEGVESINHKTVDIGGLKVHGLDYVQGKQIYEELEKIPECDILVLHQPFAHVSPFEANLLEVEGVPEQVHKAVVFGHVHISDKRKTSNGVWVVSPGSTHAQKLTHPHGAIAVYDTETNEFEFVETPEHRIMMRFVCMQELDLGPVENELKKFDSEDDRLKPIIGIKYNEDLGGQIFKLVDKYKKYIHYFPHVVPNDTVDVTLEEDEDVSTEEILSRLFESLGFDKEKKDKDLFENSLSIIEGHPEKAYEYILELEKERNEIAGIGTG